MSGGRREIVHNRCKATCNHMANRIQVQQLKNQLQHSSWQQGGWLMTHEFGHWGWQIMKYRALQIYRTWASRPVSLLMQVMKYMVLQFLDDSINIYPFLELRILNTQSIYVISILTFDFFFFFGGDSYFQNLKSNFAHDIGDNTKNPTIFMFARTYLVKIN